MAIEQETLTWVAAISGLISVVGGVYAAFAASRAADAASRSADAAKAATDHAASAEHRGLLRDVLSAAQSLVAETLRVDDLAHQLALKYRTRSAANGTLGSSREKLLVEDVASKQSGIVPLQTEARRIIDGAESLQASTSEELAARLTTLDGYLIQTRRVKEKFEHDLKSL